MSKQIPCEMIQDLLPSYVDGVSSEVSNQVIEEHVGECSVCAAMLEDMKAPEDTTAQDEQNREVDYLKKIKRRNRTIIAIVVVLAVIGVAVITKILVGIYGGQYVLTNIDYQVEVTADNVCITGKAPEGFVSDECKVKVDNGVVVANVYCVPENPLNANRDKEFQLDVEVKEPIRQVTVNDDILWQDGVEIDEYVSGVYGAKHAYIGAASDNDWLANKIGVYDSFGNFTSELQTKEEPFGWKLLLEEPVKGDVTKAQETMKKYSYIMLALIENAGEISWEYKETGATTASSYTITAEGAKEELGVDVKHYGESTVTLQELMQKLEMVE